MWREPAIAPQHIEQYIALRRKKVTPKAVNRELGNLRATFNRAVKVHKVLKENPFAHIEMLQMDPKVINPLTREEEEKLLAACAHDTELDLFVRIGLDTGCRAGEIAHLRWEDLDLKGGTGMIRCGADWRSKTRRNRFTAFSVETIERLRRWRVQRARHAYVFHNDDTHPRCVYGRVREKFDAAVTAAGAPRAGPQGPWPRGRGGLKIEFPISDEFSDGTRCGTPLMRLSARASRN